MPIKWSSAVCLLALVGLVLVAAAGCNNATSPGGGGHSKTVNIAGFAFSPASDTVAAGTAVTWKNLDSVQHTATSDAGTFNTGTLNGGASSVPITFPTPGSFAYHCSIHTTMHGTIVVQ